MSELHTKTTVAPAPAPNKRRKSWGEHLFNFSTYAGITWLGNEITSAAIWDKWINKPGTAANTFYTARTAGLSPWWQNRAKVLVLTIGGTLMVPFVKALEDNKGSLVRTADSVLEGKEARQDPQLEQAYQDMEHAPKQSWGSLMKGRLVVVGLALGLDMLSSDDHSPTHRLFKGTAVEKYSTLNRIGTSVARDAMRIPPFKWLAKSEAEQQAIQAARKAPDFVKLSAAEGKATNLLGGTFGFVLVLSAVLSAIFYVSSRVFAARRDEKIERKETIQQLEKAGVIPPKPHFFDKDTAPQTDAAPGLAVSEVSHEKTVEPKRELALAGA